MCRRLQRHCEFAQIPVIDPHLDELHHPAQVAHAHRVRGERAVGIALGYLLVQFLKFFGVGMVLRNHLPEPIPALRVRTLVGLGNTSLQHRPWVPSVRPECYTRRGVVARGNSRIRAASGVVGTAGAEDRDQRKQHHSRDTRATQSDARPPSKGSLNDVVKRLPNHGAIQLPGGGQGILSRRVFALTAERIDGEHPQRNAALCRQSRKRASRLWGMTSKEINGDRLLKF